MSLLSFNSIAFWIIAGVLFFIELLIIEDPDKDRKSKLVWPLSILIVFIGLSVWENNPHRIWSNAREATVSIMIYTTIYLAMGIIWSMIKFDKVVRDAYIRYSKSVATGEEKLRFYKPDFDDWQESVASWILLWPFSVVRYAIGNLLVDVAKWITERFRGIYQGMVNRRFREK